MSKFWAEPHIRMAIEAPGVADWALRRLATTKKHSTVESVQLEHSLFDDATIRRIIDSGDDDVMTRMFATLSRERFRGVADLLIERWPGWEDTVAAWAAGVIGDIAPAKALEVFDAYINSDALWEDFNKTAGVSKALLKMSAEPARDIAERMIEKMAVNPGGIEEAFALDQSIRLAWAHDLPALESLLIDVTTNPRRIRLAERMLAGTYSAITDGMPFFDHVRDLQQGNTNQSFTSLALLFDPSAPLEELDRLAACAEKVDIGDAFVFLCERCKLRDYRPLDVARSIVARREHAFQSALKPLIAQFFLGIGAASWLRAPGGYADLSADECVHLIASDLRELPAYEDLLARLRDCPADEVRRLVSERLSDTEDSLGAVHLCRLIGDLQYDTFIPNLLQLLSEEEGDLVVTEAIGALTRFGDLAERALVDAWDGLDTSQRTAGLEILAYVGGAATVDILVRCFPEMRSGWIEAWCDAAEAVPDARLLDVLATDLKRNHPVIDGTFLLLSTLLDSDHEQLAAVREREAARTAMSGRQNADWGSDDVQDASLSLTLKCAACGDKNVYEVTTIFVSPEASDSRPYIADELNCHSCDALDRMELTSEGYLTLMTEMLRVVAIRETGGTADSPLQFATAKMWDGRMTSLGGAIDHYTEAVAKDPRGFVDMLSLANCYVTVGREKLAASCFRKCLDIEPFSPEAAYGLAVILESDAKWAEAFRVLNRALKHRANWRFFRLADSDRADFDEAFACLYDLVAPGNKRAPRAMYHSGPVEVSRKADVKTGPNAPCPCGSGKKYKKCCGRKG